MNIPLEIIALIATQIFGFGGVIYRLAKIEERVTVHIDTLDKHDERLSDLEKGD